MVCQGCGNPKDDSEPYEMPDNTRTAPSVTDPELLRKATAGPNWKCSFCESHQRRPNGSCVQCGASPRRASAPPQPRRPPAEPTRPSVSRPAFESSEDLEPELNLNPWHRNPILYVVAGVVAIISLVLWLNRTRTFESKVDSVQWEQNILVDRYRVWEHEGWRTEVPSDAFEVHSLGNRVHHYDKVLDGYDTEHYSVDVPCGQDCRPIPRSCSEVCSSNNNGFATCRDVCSGGGQSCSTRYCSERRSRQVPRYRKEPRYAEFTRYKQWAWGHHRTLVAKGTSTTGLRWPVEEARLGEGLGEGERERERRTSRYMVTLVYDGDETFEFQVRNFAGFEIGSSHVLTIRWGNYTIDGVAIEKQGIFERSESVVPAEREG